MHFKGLVGKSKARCMKPFCGIISIYLIIFSCCLLSVRIERLL